MRAVLDTNALIFLLDSRTPPDTRDRLKGLLEDVTQARGRIILPTPVITEYLVHAGEAGRALLDALRSSKFVEVCAFDHVAADECAAMHRTGIAQGNKRHPLQRGTAWQKVKIDRQIVAIARVRGTLLISDDSDIHAIAGELRFPVQTVASLRLPGWAQQMTLEDVPVPVMQAPRPTRAAASTPDGTA